MERIYEEVGEIIEGVDSARRKLRKSENKVWCSEEMLYTPAQAELVEVYEIASEKLEEIANREVRKIVEKVENEEIGIEQAKEAGYNLGKELVEYILDKKREVGISRDWTNGPFIENPALNSEYYALPKHERIIKERFNYGGAEGAGII